MPGVPDDAGLYLEIHDPSASILGGATLASATVPHNAAGVTVKNAMVMYNPDLQTGKTYTLSCAGAWWDSKGDAHYLKETALAFTYIGNL